MKIMVVTAIGEPRILDLEGPLAVHEDKRKGNVLQDAGSDIEWFFTPEGYYDGNGQKMDAI